MSNQLHLVRASAAKGLPVVTIDTGEDAAEIKDVVFDSERHHLIGFTLNKRGWLAGSLKATLLADHIIGLGPDAVMVLSEASLTADSQAPEALADTGSAYHVVGNDVIAESGKVLGTVVDVIVETGEQPRAVGYEVKDDGGSMFVPVTAQMGLSGKNLVVPAEAEQFTRDDLAGFGAAVESFRYLLPNNDDSSSGGDA